MDKCITCGRELHPERAKKYSYCMSPECQEKNAKGLTMVAVGVNKAAEQYLILDDKTREELESGKYHDQRREFFGKPAPTAKAAEADAVRHDAATAARPARTARPLAASRTAAAPGTARKPWSKSQERLALLYNEQGLRPDEIAQKLKLSTYNVTQIILNARSRGKL